MEQSHNSPTICTATRLFLGPPSLPFFPQNRRGARGGR